MHLKSKKFIKKQNYTEQELSIFYECTNITGEIDLLVHWFNKIKNLGLLSNDKSYVISIIRLLHNAKYSGNAHKDVKFIWTSLKCGVLVDDIALLLPCLDIPLISSVKLLSWFKNLKEGNIKFTNSADLKLRLIQISKLGKDTMSLKSMQLRYGEELGFLKWQNRIKDAGKVNFEYFKSKYGYEKAKEILQSRGASLKNFVNRYGKIEGIKKWDEYKSKRKNTYSIRKNSGRNYNSFLKDVYIKKYGEEEGNIKWNEMRQKCVFSNSKNALIEKYGEEEASIIANKRWAVTSKPAFIQRYGEIAGLKKYNNYRNKLKRRMNLDSLIEEYGEEEGYEKYISRAWKSNRNSNIAHKLFEDLRAKNIMFNLEVPIFLNREERLLLGQKIIFVDGQYKNIIVEFFGDIWHANPKLYESSDTPNPFSHLTAQQIQNRDANRISILNKKGFHTIVVWEKDFRFDSNKVVDSIISVINNMHPMEKN